MDLSALKNAARGIRIPAPPDLAAFSAEQRDALWPLVESMEGLGRIVEGIRGLPDAGAPPAPLPGTQMLGPEPESQARLLPEEGVTAYGVRRGKVIGAYNTAGDAYTDYTTDGFIHFVLVAPQLPGSTDFSEVVEDRLYIKATEIRGDIDMSPVGYTDIAANDEIGYVLGGLLEQVPGLAPYFPFHGQLYHQAGGQGAQLASAYEVVTGPGIKITAISVSQDKAEVELAAVPGLEFDAGGDAGKLKVKPDTTKGIDVGAGGVFVDLASDPGLRFTGGDLEVKPNADKAVIVEAAGVGVVANVAKAIVVDANGVAVNINDGVDGLRFDANVLKTKPDNQRGIDVDGDGLYAIGNENAGIRVRAQGIETISDELRGIDVDVDGLYAKVDQARAIDVDGVGVHLLLDTTNLEFFASTLRHKQDGPTQLSSTPPYDPVPIEYLDIRTTDGVLEHRTYAEGAWGDWIAGNICFGFDLAGHVTSIVSD